ncbi:MAG: bifunctional phosphoribosylaminoimidazolecarboxamide formyltransferase/IMP cyclohydrolase [Luteibaculaceae bacterium]
MIDSKPIKSALISVFNKENLDAIVTLLHKHNVNIISTGGTQSFVEGLGIPVVPVEELTGYPSILGGRVKTLHPKIFGGILNRRDFPSDKEAMLAYDIQHIDLVIVDLYPFQETVKSGADESEIIEKIDIGGISLIRAAAKNFSDVVIVASKNQYSILQDILENQGASTNLEQRKNLAMHAFNVSSDYDTAIFNYFSMAEPNALKLSAAPMQVLRYGENPHQQGFFAGDLDAVFDKLHGKELSYNNLLDVDAAVNLMGEFSAEKPTFAILKHNNACGVATRETSKQAYLDALAGDPVSAFGGIIITNKPVDKETATELNQLFFEVVIAPAYQPEALEVLKLKKNRIILVQKQHNFSQQQVRTCLNGFLVQDKDLKTETRENLTTATQQKVDDSKVDDLLFANKLVKHTKSNTIVLAKNKQLLASGTGQTSRVDALNQAIHKAKSFGFDLNGAVMASDAFFPFPDCVEIAFNQGITTVIQPGGSIKDQDSIDFCDTNKMAMVFTGIRHFKH